MVKTTYEVLLDGDVGTDGLYKFSSLNLSNSSPKTSPSTSPIPTVTHNSSSALSIYPLPCFTHSSLDSPLNLSFKPTHNTPSNNSAGANSPSTSHTESSSPFTTQSARGVHSEDDPSLSASPFISPGLGSTQSMSPTESSSSTNSESYTHVVIPLKVVHVDVRPVNNHVMQTRAKSGFSQPRLEPKLLLTLSEPKIVKHVLADL
ncbi:hypothetical protein KIW84_051419 [Lathyrus oleraceus]|uniref:Uncharacterized protein n=1 Tax=Pisum sativum TaxID=3888 RepID=A0A9D4WP24_PEA|nr:hypothetical protein KIW84_051419 [Pisum sativum]